MSNLSPTLLQQLGILKNELVVINLSVDDINFKYTEYTHIRYYSLIEYIGDKTNVNITYNEVSIYPQ